MCAPSAVFMFAASAALSVASAAASASSKSAAYGKSIEAAHQEVDAINRSVIFKHAMNGLQQQQVQDQATIQEGQERLKLSGAVGEASAAAASGGVTGASVAELYRSYAVATGSDLMSIQADEKGKIAQAQSAKRADQMSAENQILGVKESLPENPSTSIMGDMVGAALGVGKAFTQNTSLITDKSQMTGGLFGGGGILGLGRSWG